MIATIQQYYSKTNTLIDADMLNSATWYEYVKLYADEYIQTHYYRHLFNNACYEISNTLSDADIIDTIKRIVRVHLYSRAYTYEKLYETTQLEYNPLWNVDGEEVTQRQYISSNNNVQTLNTTDATVYNKQENNSDDTTNNLMHTDVKDEHSNKSNSNTAETSNTLYLREEEDTVSSANNSSTDTGTIKKSLISQTNSHEDLTHSGTIDDTRNINDNETTTLKRTGNIGVTKTTDLIDSQRLTVDFNFIQRVCTDIIAEICEGVY